MQSFCCCVAKMKELSKSTLFDRTTKTDTPRFCRRDAFAFVCYPECLAVLQIQLRKSDLHSLVYLLAISGKHEGVVTDLLLREWVPMFFRAFLKRNRCVLPLCPGIISLRASKNFRMQPRNSVHFENPRLTKCQFDSPARTLF